MKTFYSYPSVKHSTGQEFPQFFDGVLMRFSSISCVPVVSRARVSRCLNQRLTEAAHEDEHT